MRNFFRGAVRRLRREPVQHTQPVPVEVALPSDLTPEEAEVYRKVEPYTMTGVDRVVTLIRAVKYLVDNGIEGDFVECGVWRGGSMMAVAYALRNLGITDRKLFLFDTFSGMTAPSGEDARYDGESASNLLARATREEPIWAYASLEDATANLASTEYPRENIRFVQGKVEETIPREAPSRICLLRLDTDWYESTRHELTHLYPRLERNGILIIDDYGHWRGAKQATDEFFNQSRPAPFLHRVDYTGRLVVKT
jgi:O-methyltransferase